MRASLVAALIGAVGLIVVGGGAARIAATAPKNTAPPTVSGSALVGQTLTAAKGTWTGTAPITYVFAWQRCDSSAANCSAIAGATSSTYKVTNADLGARLMVVVTATNATGNSSVNSAATAAVATASGKPANVKAPTVSGTPSVGQAVTAVPGTWSGDQPVTYSYQWQACDAEGNACKAVSNGDKASYTVVKSEVGGTLRVQVTAVNSRGNGKAISAPSEVVTDAGGGTGIIDIGGGKKSADVGSVVAGQRLVVERVSFSPDPVRSRSQTITATITVTDTRGYYVRDAWVFIRSTPLVSDSGPDKLTGVDGKVTFTIKPQSDFPIKKGYNVQFFVKAYRKGDDALAGISGTRLVQVGTKP